MNQKGKNVTDQIMKNEDLDALVEALAAVEHERWSGWERYRESCTASHLAHGGDEAPETRWRRQRSTPYADLSEKEKESDRVEARKSVKVMLAHLQRIFDRDAPLATVVIDKPVDDKVMEKLKEFMSQRHDVIPIQHQPVMVIPGNVKMILLSGQTSGPPIEDDKRMWADVCLACARSACGFHDDVRAGKCICGPWCVIGKDKDGKHMAREMGGYWARHRFSAYSVLKDAERAISTDQNPAMADERVVTVREWLDIRKRESLS